MSPSLARTQPTAATPNPDPSPGPTSSPSPTPSSEPTPLGYVDRDLSDLPEPPVAQDPPGTERVDLRTAYSRTFDQSDGKRTVEFYSEPVFYQRDGALTGSRSISGSARPKRRVRRPAQPSQLRAYHCLRPTRQLASCPLRAAVTRSASPARRHGGGHGRYRDVSRQRHLRAICRLPARRCRIPYLPAARRLQHLPRLPHRPKTNSFTFAISSDLSVVDEKDGSFTFRDVEATLPTASQPFLNHSSEVEGRGGGLYSEAVTLVPPQPAIRRF